MSLYVRNFFKLKLFQFLVIIFNALLCYNLCTLRIKSNNLTRNKIKDRELCYPPEISVVV